VQQRLCELQWIATGFLLGTGSRLSLVCQNLKFDLPDGSRAMETVASRAAPRGAEADLYRCFQEY